MKKRVAGKSTKRRGHGWLGWMPDLPDPRDHTYRAPKTTRLPRRYTLPVEMLPEVFHQGAIGSCSANAIAAAIHFERKRQHLPEARRVPSRLFIYFNQRVILGTVDQDSGAHLRDGIKVVASHGDCFESGIAAWPYNTRRLKSKPPRECYRMARTDRVIGYKRVKQTLSQLRGCLASGFPFIFGITIFESFESHKVARTGKVPMPGAAERMVGGHAVLAVGYDDDAQVFLVRNSWGTQWGKDGHFTLPYAYVTHKRLAGDFWTIRAVSP